MCAVLLLGLSILPRASAQEQLCDNAYEDCRTPIRQLIRNETVGLDVSFWFMTDNRYSQEIIKRWQAGFRCACCSISGRRELPGEHSIRSR